MKIVLQSLALSLLVVSLAGCNNEKVRNLIDTRTDEADMAIKEAKAPAPPKSFNPLVVSDRIWTGTTAVRMRRGLPLPARFEGDKGVTLVAADPLPLVEIAGIVSSQTGIPVRIAPGTVQAAAPLSATATSASQSSGSSGAIPPGSSGAPNSMLGMPGQPGIQPNQGGTPRVASAPSSLPNSGNMMLAYEGPLSNILDQVAAYFGVNWRYDGTSINFSRLETRVFVIEAMPGTQSVTEDVSQNNSASAGSSGGEDSGGSEGTSALTQSSSVKVDYNVWDELNKTITGILNGTGNLVAAPSNGTITVTTTPEIMRLVADYVKQENRRMTRQIGINVEVYNVVMQDGSDFSVSWETALQRWKSFGFNVTGTAAPVLSDVADPLTNAGQVGVAILNPNTTGEITGLFQALSSVGDASRVAQFPMTTLNNKPVSRRVGSDRAYVSKLTSDTTSTSGSTPVVSKTFEVGTIRQGFSLMLTPRVLDDGRIMLQYSMNLIDLIALKTFPENPGPEDDQVQLPETNNRVFVQQSLLKSGSTLIIGGFDDEQASQSSQGVGDAYNYLLGGGSRTKNSRSMLFIAITPQILDVPRAEQE